MDASRESESGLPLGPRRRGWWWRPLAWTLGALYAGQLVPFLFGPLTECDHCVGNYLRFFVVVPGIVVGHWFSNFLRDVLPGGKNLDSDLWRFFVPGVLTYLAMVFSMTLLTAKCAGKWRWAWLAVVTALSAANALIFAAALRS